MRPLVVVSRLAVWSRRREVWALVAMMMALAAVALLPLERPIDAVAAGWLHDYGGKRAHAVARYLDGGARLALLIAAAAVAFYRRRRDLAAAILTLGSGAFVGELLKTAIERPRPSAPYGVVVGNSLPSGHIMNTTMAAVLVCLLAWKAEWSARTKRLVVIVAVLAVAAQSTGRMIRGSHWPSDVAPSILLGIAWVLGATAWSTARRGIRIGVVVACVAAYALFYEVPALRLHVPAVSRPQAVHSNAAAGLTPRF